MGMPPCNRILNCSPDVIPGSNSNPELFAERHKDMPYQLFTNIFDAARYGSVNEVKYCVEKSDFDINLFDDEDILTPLHHAAISNSVEVVQFLISQGSNIHARNFDDDTPLHLAAYTNSVEVIKYLISQGSSIHAENKHGHTPLHMAAYRNSVEVVEHLISQGSSVLVADKVGLTPLHIAAFNNSVDVVKVLILRGSDVFAKSFDGCMLFIFSNLTPLDLADTDEKKQVLCEAMQRT